MHAGLHGILQLAEEGKASRQELDELESYYTGEEWKQDFAADEAGLLPKDLKRGVLLEDGIWNVLEQYKEQPAGKCRSWSEGDPILEEYHDLEWCKINHDDNF